MITEAPSGEEIEGREVETAEAQEDNGEEKGEEDGGWLAWGTKPASWGVSSISSVTHAVQKTVSMSLSNITL